MSTRFDLLLHPVRMRIVQALAGGRRLSASELAVRLASMPSTTLDRHLDVLIEEGAVVIADERQEAASDEPSYRLNQEASITPADLRLATPADHMRYLSTFVSGLLDTYSRYLKRPQLDPVDDGVSVREMILHLTKDELRTLKQDLYERIQREFPNEPGDDRAPHVLAWIIMPEEPPRDDS